MPLLSADDPLPHPPRRVLVAGTSGSGKTSTAARIAALLQIQHIEIDALFHGPDWTPRESFESDVRAFTAEDSWTTEWQYGPVRPLLAERADALVWLHFRRATVMRRVIRRTLRRRLRRERLWNDNVEPSLWTFFTDRDHIVRWAWRTHREQAAKVEALLVTHPDLPIVELSSQRDVERWLRGPLMARTKA